ncbi:TPA: oligosaccharide flippase family protein [Streptococcus suis]|nr:oligosaccharide flippase family protein [Streptococcus suis]HEM6103338.1 oligosaccharide flippase family protein [Streptococcus suis]
MTSQIQRHNYKKISTYYIIGTLFNQGISFLTVPIFSRLLTPYDYGVVNTYTSWVAIASMIISCAVYMGIRSAFVEFEENINDVMSTLTTLTLLNGAICLIVIGICIFFIDIKNPELILLGLGNAVGQALLQNYSMYQMMKFDYRFRTFLLVFPNLLAVLISLFTVLYLFSDYRYLGRIIPTALTQLFFGLFITYLIYRKSLIIWNFYYVRFALKISLPLVLHGIALNILSQSDRLMITAFRNASETGIYSLVYNFGMLATVITTGLDGVWVPWFTNKLKNNEESIINTQVKYYIEFMTFAMCGLILIGPEIIKILAGRDYWDGIRLVPPIVLANLLIFAYTLYVNVEHYYKKTVFITINTVIAATINLITNYLFIPKYGYFAAAFTTLFSYGVAFFLHANYSKELNRDLYPISYFIFPFFKILGVVIIFYIFVDSIIIRWLFAAVLFLIEIFQYRELIIEQIKQLKKK